MLEFQFCNNKSVELFGLVLPQPAELEGDALNELERQRFIPPGKEVAVDRAKTKPKSKEQGETIQFEMLSLKDVILNPAFDVGKEVRYTMKVGSNEQEAGAANRDRTLIVKRMSLIFNEKECHVLNFTDITTENLLQLEQDRVTLLKQQSVSIHHEILHPLKINVEVSERLMSALRKSKVDTKLKAMADMIFSSG